MDNGKSTAKDWRQFLKTVNLYLTPVTSLVVIIQFVDKVLLLLEHRVVTLVGLGLFAVLALFYFLDLRQRIASILRRFRVPTPTLSRKRDVLVVVGALVAIIAVTATIGYVVWGATIGYHYVLIASFEKQKAVQEAALISQILEDSQQSKLRVRAYSSGPGKPYYALMLGRPFLSATHFTEEGARRAFREAYPLIGDHVDENPRLISYYLFRGRTWQPLTIPS